MYSFILIFSPFLYLTSAKATIKRRNEDTSRKSTSKLPHLSISMDLTSRPPLNSSRVKSSSRLSDKSSRIVLNSIPPSISSSIEHTSRLPKNKQLIGNNEETRLSVEFSEDYISSDEDLSDEISGKLSFKDQLQMAPVVEGTVNELLPLKQLSNAQEKMIINRIANNGVANSVPKWEYGIVPYRIDANSFDLLLNVHLRKAMDIIEASSCLRFKEVEEPSDGMTWLHFTNPDRIRECVHTTTRGDNGDVVITLGLECIKTRDLLHSILHGLGFIDEVTHPHRDQYIRILWENVQPKYRSLFTISREEPEKLVEYDPMSIMHFHDRAFSGNGGLTIVPVMHGLTINPSDKLSQLDVMKLRLAFGQECNKRKVGDIVQNCKNILYKKNVGNESRQDNDKPDNDNKNNDNEKEGNNENDNGVAYRHSDVEVSDTDVEKTQLIEKGDMKIEDVDKKTKYLSKDAVADEVISAGDDLQARRFPSHLKFENIPYSRNIH